MGRLSVELSGIQLDNPLIPASGTFGYGMDYLDFFDVNLLSAFSMKGTTLNPRYGNNLPRICEIPSGMINSVGLQNPGVHEVINSVFPEVKKHYHNHIIANVSGFSLEEYVETAALLDKEEQVSLIELNISCPNVHGGGMSFGTDIPSAVSVLKAVKAVCKKPVYVKCTPQCPDLVAMCKALEENGADGLVLLNTFLGMRLDFKTGKPIMANVTGGVSGPCVFPMVLQKIYAVSQAVNIPIIGCGGISSARDVIEMMSAGASAVEIGTAGLIDPMVYPKILKELPELLDQLKVENITELVGRSHK